MGLIGAVGLFGGGWAVRVVEVVWLACMVRLVRLVRVDRAIRLVWVIDKAGLGCKAG